MDRLDGIKEVWGRLKSFSELPKGWNFGEGVPSAPIPFTNAVRILSVTNWAAVSDVEVFPGINGEIQISFYKNEASLDMILELDDSINITFEEGDVIDKLARQASLTKAIKILKDFEFNKCRSYVSLIYPITTVSEKTVLLALPSVRQAMVQAYPSSKKTAPNATVNLYATMQRPITQKQRERPSSIGKSETLKFHRPVKLSIA